VRAIYVTLDKGNAVESAPSELNAWNSYTYTGLNTVVEGTETTITVDGATAIDDVIGFRVYAVNVDGTLVDPDGKAFYVQLGTPAGTWPVVATVATPTSTTITPSAEAAVTLSKLAASTSYTYTWTADKAEAYGTPASTPLAAAFNVQFLPATGTTALFTTATSATDVTFTAPDFSTVKKIVAVPTESNWLAYKDGKVYNGTLTIKNASGHILTTLDVTFKKELPTAAPKGFSAKTSQIINGIYNAYLIPTPTWTAPNASHGMMKLTNVFNFEDDAAGKEANFNFSFAASEEDTSTPVKLIAVDVNGNGSIVVAKKFIDNTTKHATTVSYNYGTISTETKNAAGTVIPYTLEVLNFETVYNNIYNSTYSWNWATRDQLHKVFPTDGWNVKDTSGNFTKALPSKTVVYNTQTDFELGYIYGVSTHNPTAYNAPLSNSFGPNSLDIANATVKFVSNSNKVAEYFDASIASIAGTTKVVLTPKSGTTNPGAAVESTLEIKVEDMYGVEHTITIPFTVLKQ
ncbi:MAG: cell surface protein, partial [Fermentimonas sp.]|nr:cell surface protein [Fermentimonas sp.]